MIFLLITHSDLYYLMESIEISSISDSSDAVELSSDVSFSDSTVTYDSGEFHCVDGTEHCPPTPEETTDDENERLCREKTILDALQVELVLEVLIDYCIICCQDYKVREMIAWSFRNTEKRLVIILMHQFQIFLAHFKCVRTRL